MPAATRNEIKMDPDALYREDVYTDRRMGSIRVLTPVRSDGATDPARSLLYLGETQILTPMGALPIAFQIEAKTLAEAIERFGDSAQVAIENTSREIQEMRREAASGLVIADRLPPGASGMSGGGKIQLP